MSFITNFEEFKNGSKITTIFVSNPEAEKLIEENRDFYTDVEIIDLLETNNFSYPDDFTSADLYINEELAVTYDGHDNSGDKLEIKVSVNGHKYGYSQKEGDLDIGDIARKFEKMLQFSAGKALSWLKKHTVLSSGSKSQEAKEIEKK